MQTLRQERGTGIVCMFVCAGGDNQMVSTVYKRCLDIVQLCKDKQYLKEVPIQELTTIIAQHIAGDPRQINLYIKRLETFQLMKHLNPYVMQIIQTQKVPEHLDELIFKQYGIKPIE